MLNTYNNSQALKFTTQSGTEIAIAFMPFAHDGRYIPQLQMLRKTGNTWQSLSKLDERTPMWGTSTDERENIPANMLVRAILKDFNKDLPQEDRVESLEKWEEILEYMIKNVTFHNGELVDKSA